MSGTTPAVTPVARGTSASVPGAGDPWPELPIACTCDLAGSQHPTLSALLAVRLAGGSRSCRWHLGKLDSDRDAELGQAACSVADGTMRWRCRGARQTYEAWRTAVTSGVALEGKDREKVVPFVQTLFGLPGRARPDEHARGWLAEYVWYQLSAELDDVPERLIRLEGPSFHATEPGGDGLAVWARVADGLLAFCIWEIKSHIGAAGISSTVGRAYRQIGTRATEYLAKLTGIEAVARADPALDELYAGLVDLWVDCSDRAGAGVAVVTHAHLAPARCFSTMYHHFPGRTSPGQLQGLVAAIGDFATFTRDVRERVWTPL